MKAPNRLFDGVLIQFSRARVHPNVNDADIPLCTSRLQLDRDLSDFDSLNESEILATTKLPLKFSSTYNMLRLSELQQKIIYRKCRGAEIAR